MLYYNNNEWYISDVQVKFTDSEVEYIKYVGQEGLEWWSELEDLHENIIIVEFIDVEVTDEQLERLEEINELNIGDGHSNILGDYVIDNNFPLEVNHVLKDLQNKKENEILKQENAILKTKLQANNDVTDFHEELIVELAMQLY